MLIQNDTDLAGMRAAGQVVALTLQTLRAAAQPGVTPAELNHLAGEIFAQHGAISAPRAEYGAPVNVFISVNEDIVHGLPTTRPLQRGDVVCIDVTPNVGGYVADAALSLAIEEASPTVTRLLRCTEDALNAALKVAKAGQPISAIGKAIETVVRKEGFTVLRELQGHGVGRAIHEEPEVPNYFDPARRERLEEGLVIAVEPMVSTGRDWHTQTLSDGWTIATRDGGLAAHFEHTIMIQRGKPLVLTALDVNNSG